MQEGDSVMPADVSRRRERRPRSIRSRVTVGAVVVVGAALVLAITGASLITRDAIQRDISDRTAAAARHVVELAQQRRIDGPIPAQGGVTRLQVVDEDGRVVAASATLQGYAPLTHARPENGDFRIDTTVCRTSAAVAGCLTVVGFREKKSAYGDVMVYAAARQPAVLSGIVLELMLVVLGLVVLAVVGWVTWWGVGRTLRPVETIRADLERLTASELDRRLTVPDTGDEIADLARTANATLDRLETAMQRQARFVADASHELRNPIAGLRVRLELQLSEPEGEEVAETLRGALADIERLEGIVNDLLELARLDADVATARESVDLAELAAREVRGRVTAKEVTTALTPGTVVAGNRLRLARLLVNLLANAERHAQNRILVTVGAEGDDAVLRVHDDGHGIAPEDREQIFERFSRLSESRRRDPGGSGLGLAIAREVARAHGGQVEAGESPELGGAVFTLRLPRA
ncbi:HAMP domain-containing sensor histidine kinase [Nocardiopsis rhodophaea]|uniref:histidine kinase n=1 Tax=Nocardiopsis rhodophaea TaxID=280238 RepID=A0ABP5E1A6_9ACTN